MTVPMEIAARDFLSQRRLAVVGVSRTRDMAPGNLIYRRLRKLGYEVFAVNPAGGEIDGSPLYSRVEEVPGPLDGVIVATPPDATRDVARSCARLGVPRVWIHGGLPPGSVSREAKSVLHGAGVSFIAGGCPLMYVRDADLVHRCMRLVMHHLGSLPRKVQYEGSGSDEPRPFGRHH